MAACNYPKERDDLVIQQLHEVFGSSLNLDVIKSVAKSCKFDVRKSSNQLIELTNGAMNKPTNQHSFLNSPVGNGTLQRVSKKQMDIDNAIARIKAGYKVLVLLRGVPGSGKSTLAKTILESTIGYNGGTVQKHILSTDDYFMKTGVYKHNPNQLTLAHDWNHERAFRAMSQGYSPVIIDNTNTQMWEMKPYAVMATDFGYYLEILEPNTHWCFEPKELSKRNKHDVPKEKIKQMIDRYQKNVTPMKLLTAYDCKYKLQRPPQLRTFPPIQNKRPIEQPQNKSFLRTESIQKSSPPDVTTKETINLMNFDDFEPFPRPQSPVQIKNSTLTENLLMNGDVSSLKSPTLKPEQTFSSGLFDNMKNAWGIDKQALLSWDIVTPINDTDFNSIQLTSIEIENEVETNVACTSTEDQDFYVLRNVLQCVPPKDQYKILTTCSRDINRNVPSKPQGVKKILMLDKSCLTDDYLENDGAILEQLERLFPNISVTSLRYWFNKCNRDFDCTIELLLHEPEETIQNGVDEDQITNNVPEAIIVDSDSGSSNSSETIAGSSRPKKSKYKHNFNATSSSQETEILKKCIESKITISDDHYSERLLKIKQVRYGEASHSRQVSETSQDQQFDSDSNSEESRSENDEGIEDELCTHGFIDMQETIELHLGDMFVQQLEGLFGDPSLLYPKGFQPVVQVPKALAEQLYTFYIESVYQQMDAQNNIMDELVKEDEEFAKKLQEDEEKGFQNEQPPLGKAEPTEMPDIMREQKELSKWQKEIDKWKQLTPDTLAAKLTRDKLFKAFPNINQATLVEILFAHDNVYEDTVDTLLASTGLSNIPDDVKELREPPISSSVLTEMWEAHQSCKTNNVDKNANSAAAYREEANEHLQSRTGLYEKAQKYYQSGMREVAQFYTALASEQTKLYEKSNSLAATAFLDEHSKRLQDFNTIDLHFLYVKEAIPSLDMFLDRNINLLRLSSSRQMEQLQIITGRGKNSQMGVAKLKPAVISRLKQRDLSFVFLNPGLLKLKITKGSKLTSEL